MPPSELPSGTTAPDPHPVASLAQPLVPGAIIHPTGPQPLLAAPARPQPIIAQAPIAVQMPAPRLATLPPPPPPPAVEVADPIVLQAASPAGSGTLPPATPPPASPVGASTPSPLPRLKPPRARLTLLATAPVLAALIVGGWAAWSVIHHATAPKNQPVSFLNLSTIKPVGTLPPTYISATGVSATSVQANNLVVAGASQLQGTADVQGDLSVGNDLTVGGNATVGGTVSAASFLGSGSALTGLNAAACADCVELQHVAIPTAQVGNVSIQGTVSSTSLASSTASVTGVATAGAITTGSLAGSGSSLTVGGSTQDLLLQGASVTVANISSGIATSLVFTGAPAGRVTYTLDTSATPGTYEICSSNGNCSSGGVTAPGSGTAGFVARFSGAQTIADSIIYDSGSAIGIGTSSPSAKLDVTGNVNTSGQYQIGGVQISSANLSDSTNLAKLNGTQTFTGSNTFTGTVLDKNASNSTTAFQVQNASAAPVLVADTTNTKVGIGTAPTAGGATLQVSGSIAGIGVYQNGNQVCDVSGNCVGSGGAGSAIGGSGTTNSIALFTAAGTIGNSILTQSGTVITATGTLNATSGFQDNGTSGSVTTCTSGYVLANIVVSGGIVTSGSCAVNGGGISPTLQQIYGNSAPATIALSSVNGGVTLQDAATPLGTNLLAVQNNTGSTTYLAVTSTGLDVTGNVNTSGQYQIGGVQISSANLSDSTNLAKLNGTQTFTGSNTFTGTVLDKNASNSTTAFQIQNASAASVLTVDTTNLRVSVGTNGTPTGQLYVSGSVPTAAIGSVATGSNPVSVAISGRYAYVANYGANTLQIIDVSNPASPVVVGSVTTGSGPQSVTVAGRYAYVVNNNGASTLQIIDISNPASPVVVGSVATGSNPSFVAVSGRFAYVANYGASTLQIIDISNPTSPAVVGSVATGSGPLFVTVQGRYAYVANYGAATLQVIDVSNPTSPAVVGSVATGSHPYSVAVAGRYAYVANNGPSTMQIIDVSNPTSPAVVGSVATGANPQSVTVAGRYAYVANEGANTLQIIDVSNPASPVAVGSVTTGSQPYSVALSGRYAYVVNYGAATLQIFDLGGAYIQQLQAGSTETGTLAVDTNASVNGDASIQGGLAVGQSLQVSGNIGASGQVLFQNTANSTTAFRVQNASAASVLTVDTTNQRVSVGTTGTPTGQLYVSGSVPTAAIGSVATGSNPYSVAVSGRYAYVANEGASTLQVIDASNPASPVVVGSVATGSNPESVTVAGHYAYVANYGASTLQIIDISNPASPAVVGSVATAGSSVSVAVSGRYAYVANKGANTLQVIDISNPASPAVVGSVATGSWPFSVALSGRYAYVANYSASTLQIIDISNPTSPAVVGSVATGSGPFSVTVAGRYAYVANNGASTLQIIDISNPASPAVVGSVATGSNPQSVTVAGRYAYLANNSANTLQVIDISNPASPAVVGSVATGSSPQSVAVSGRYAYVANAGASTLQIFDLGGAYIQQLQAGSTETGTLVVDTNASINGDASIQGGLAVGQSLQVSGNIGASGQVLFQNATNSTTAFQIQNASGIAVLTVDTTNLKVQLAASADLEFLGVGNAENAITKKFICTVACAAGDVVVIDTANPGQVTELGTANSPLVAGVVVTGASAGGTAEVALSGVVQATMITTPAVNVGDLLITSATAGQGEDASVNSVTAAPGTVIGKALSAKAGSTSGQVWVLLTNN